MKKQQFYLIKQSRHPPRRNKTLFIAIVSWMPKITANSCFLDVCGGVGIRLNESVKSKSVERGKKSCANSAIISRRVNERLHSPIGQENKLKSLWLLINVKMCASESRSVAALLPRDANCFLIIIRGGKVSWARTKNDIEFRSPVHASWR